MEQEIRRDTFKVIFYRIILTMTWLFAFYEVFHSSTISPFHKIKGSFYLYNQPLKRYIYLFLIVMLVYYLGVVFKGGFDLKNKNCIYRGNRRYRAYLSNRSSDVIEPYYRFRYSLLVDSFIFILKVILMITLIKSPFTKSDISGISSLKALLIITVHYILEQLERNNLKRIDKNLSRYLEELLNQDKLGNEFEIVDKQRMYDIDLRYTLRDSKTGINYYLNH